jgi:hypothetical protein
MHTASAALETRMRHLAVFLSFRRKGGGQRPVATHVLLRFSLPPRGDWVFAALPGDGNDSARTRVEGSDSLVEGSDRGLTDPHAPASGAASSAQAVAAPSRAASIDAPGAPGEEERQEDSDRESTEHAPSVGQRGSEDEREIATLVSAQPPGSQAENPVVAEPREQKLAAAANPPQGVVRDED